MLALVFCVSSVLANCVNVAVIRQGPLVDVGLLSNAWLGEQLGVGADNGGVSRGFKASDHYGQCQGVGNCGLYRKTDLDITVKGYGDPYGSLPREATLELARRAMSLGLEHTRVASSYMVGVADGEYCGNVGWHKTTNCFWGGRLNQFTAVRVTPCGGGAAIASMEVTVNRAPTKSVCTLGDLTLAIGAILAPKLPKVSAGVTVTGTFIVHQCSKGFSAARTTNGTQICEILRARNIPGEYFGQKLSPEETYARCKNETLQLID
jgi:hypothetical protein